jgi:extradiol dioxygenase family protein
MLGHKIKGLGEIVLRVNNMELMRNFYQYILGLELIRGSEEYTFLKIAEGYGGHTQIIALFAKTNLNAFNEELGCIDAINSSLHHVALEIEKNDYQDIISLLDVHEIKYEIEIFEWVKWKSIFIKDPELNVVEFVCYDSNL